MFLRSWIVASECSPLFIPCVIEIANETPFHETRIICLSVWELPTNNCRIFYIPTYGNDFIVFSLPFLESGVA